MKGFVRDAIMADAAILAARLRTADVAEIKAMSGKEPLEAITNVIAQGEKVRVACLPDDTPVAIFGIERMTDKVGAIWMVASQDFQKLHRQFLRECRSGIAEMAADYDLIYNFTDARNKVHHRWIKWAGFTIIKRHEKVGFEQRPFLEFVKITGGPHV